MRLFKCFVVFLVMDLIGLPSRLPNCPIGAFPFIPTAVRGVLICVLLSFGSTSKAQPRIKFKHFSQEDGLFDDRINSILQDRQGFMWFGSKDGLNRYDGYRFKNYRHDPEDPGSLADNAIASLYEDRRGMLLDRNQ